VSDLEQQSLFGSYKPKLQARRTDPETSAAAARRLRPDSAKAALLKRYYLFDLTDEQAAEQAGLDLYTASKRCADLRRDGFVEAVGFAAGASGNDRMVCRITDAGRSAVFMFAAKKNNYVQPERPRRGPAGD
jgi:hypothetical protein